MIIKANPADAGCWVDGSNGIYISALVVHIASDYGYENPELIDIADRMAMQQIYPKIYPSREDITGEESITLDDKVDDAIEWMNDNVAPEGYSFGMYDGEFFFMPDEWWEEQ